MRYPSYQLVSNSKFEQLVLGAYPKLTKVPTVKLHYKLELAWLQQQMVRFNWAALNYIGQSIQADQLSNRREIEVANFNLEWTHNTSRSKVYFFSPCQNNYAVMRSLLGNFAFSDPFFKFIKRDLNLSLIEWQLAKTNQRLIKLGLDPLEPLEYILNLEP